MKPQDYKAKLRAQIHPTDECIAFAGAKALNGYGVVSDGGLLRGSVRQRLRLAHRVVYEMTHDIHLDPVNKVRHSCDNPPCINPRHLLLGSQADNVRDAIVRGRLPVKLTVDDVRMIRSLAGTMSQTRLAKQFGVGQTTISRVIRRLDWRHV